MAPMSAIATAKQWDVGSPRGPGVGKVGFNSEQGVLGGEFSKKIQRAIEFLGGSKERSGLKDTFAFRARPKVGDF